MLTMLNDRVDYDKRSFRSYPHDRIVIFKWWKRASNLNDRVDYGNDHLDHIHTIV